jgi:HD-GYP domain-containing protein (c-di-GMP phosphodiesterase class II)
VKFLTDDEVYNLTVERGTLTPEERKVINNHIVVTVNMLNALPYPKDLARVPEYAGGHHERMDGMGYPKGLTRDEMSIPARMMGVADIFEALTSKDRPYKKAKTLSETLMILGQMKLDHHIDPDIFDLFMREKIYLKYAEKFLEPSQIDHVDLASIPGYVA